MRPKLNLRKAPFAVEVLESRLFLDAVLVGTGNSTLAGQVITNTGAPAAGVPVYLDLNDNNILDNSEPSTISDAMGNFTFLQLAAGRYHVAAIGQAGYQPQPPGFVTVDVPANGINSQVAVIIETNAPGISGTLFYDANQTNTFQPPNDTPLAGDTVYIDANGNGVLDAGETTSTTDALGNFYFDVAPGTYQLRVVPRNGFHQNAPGYINVVVGSSGQALQNIGETNFAEVDGVLFYDANGNGNQDPGEAPVSGETIMAQPVGMNPATTSSMAITDANGHFSLLGLDAGTYRLTVKVDPNTLLSPAGYVLDNPGYVDVTVTQGQVVTQNLAEGLPVSFSGTIFGDINGNGVLDANEVGAQGLTAFVDVNNNGVNDAAGLGADMLPLPTPEPSAVTNASGHFLLNDYFDSSGTPVGLLGPGTYTIRAIYPNASIPSAPNNSSRDYTLSMVSGQSATGLNFGFQAPDLAIQTLKFPTNPIFGGIDQRAVFRVVNVGSLPAEGTVGITIYASPTQSFNSATSSIVLTSPQTAIALKPGQSKIFRVKFSYPVTLLSGTYYMFGFINTSVQDSNAANNYTTPVGPVQETQPQLDLALSYVDQPLAIVNPGQALPLDMMVVNNGNTRSVSTLTFRIYVANAPTLEPTDVVVQRVKFYHVSLKPGQSRIFHLVMKNPGANLGTRYPIVTLDNGNPLGDINSDNNTAVALFPTQFL